MFGYAKDDIDEKISKAKKQLSLWKSKEDRSQIELKRVHSCIACYRRIIHQKNNSLYFGVLFVPSVIAFVYLGFFSIPAVASGLIAGITAIGATFSGVKLFQEKRSFKQKYSDFMEFDLQQLSEEASRLLDLEFESKHKQIDTTRQIRRLEHERDQLIRYENIYNDFEKLKQDPYYISDTASEYEDYLKQRSLYDNAFEEYLNERVHPEHVDFSNTVDSKVSCSKK
ncbi:MAG: hypothetical protein K2G03_00750, partial [Bacilli bacterium]|nr:hypothetical protein [Bacilli bacterium]